MFRWLTPFRRYSRSTLKELDSLHKIRKYPILLGCLSSGILYHNFMAHNNTMTSIENKPKQKGTEHPIFEDLILLFNEGNSDQSSNKLPNEAKMDRLLKLNQEIEDELPLFFEKGLFDEVPKNLLDSDTVVYYQRKNGSVHELKGKSWIRTLVVASRAYFYARSYGRRLELTSILSDTEKWEVEVSFRIVLLPAPSKEESHLPPDRLLERLEQRARWYNFRATFYLSDAGKVNAIKLTQILPPFKDSTNLYPLNRLALWKPIGPGLPGRRRLPTPTPYVYGELALQQTLDNHDSDCNNSNLLLIFEGIKTQPDEFLHHLGKIIEPLDVAIDSLPSNKNYIDLTMKFNQDVCCCPSDDQVICFSLPFVNILYKSYSSNSTLLEFYIKHLASARKNVQTTAINGQSNPVNCSTSYITQLRRITCSPHIPLKSFCITSGKHFSLSNCFAAFPSTDDVSPVFCLSKSYI
ncbi:unnamed protein product [Heterobilharzia americana]|nr:unnamed protein product [Heterobilharzia americana]